MRNPPDSLCCRAGCFSVPIQRRGRTRDRTRVSCVAAAGRGLGRELVPRSGAGYFPARESTQSSPGAVPPVPQNALYGGTCKTSSGIPITQMCPAAATRLSHGKSMRYTIWRTTPHQSAPMALTASPRGEAFVAVLRLSAYPQSLPLEGKVPQCSHWGGCGVTLSVTACAVTAPQKGKPIEPREQKVKATYAWTCLATTV